MPSPGSRRGVLEFWSDLAAHGDAVALRTTAGEVRYQELAERVGDASHSLGVDRQLVVLAGSNEFDTVVWYLAALAGSHPLILSGADDRGVDRLVEHYDPDVVIRAGRPPRRRHDHPAHELHPDLALLLSTSGSTGSPKLVRLSHENLTSNAAAIASYLGLTANDRAITSLPLHYCYGLSVLNSHLHVGASVVLSDLSVVDPCFWETVRKEGVTGLAGVPHTFALLDRVGSNSMDGTSLRYITQAGGRLAPETVRRYAKLGRSSGWDLFVMYGQTEATARMAYLPPALAAEHPGAVGVPIPGGAITIDPVAEDDAPGQGEIVYAGPNVMLGYADSPADLALGRTVHELRTGDIGRRNDAGLIEITGRRSRFAKLYGLRVDLGAIESHLADWAIPALCASDDARLFIAVTRGADPDEVTALVRGTVAIPATAIEVVGVDDLPRLSSGKPDYAAVTALAPDSPTSLAAPTTGDCDPIRVLYGQCLRIADPASIDDTDTFTSLGGDSLSYVELSVALEEHLGELPTGWHLAPIADLTATVPTRARWWRGLDTSIVLRAVAIVLIVGNHSRLFLLPGGAHILLAVAGFNLARFALAAPTMWPAIIRIVVPSICWIGLAAAVSDEWDIRHALLINSYLGTSGARWSYWFIETLVVLLIVTAIMFTLPAIRRLDRARPFGFPLGITAVGLAIRFDLLELDQSHQILRPQGVLWLFALGWAAARSTSARHRALLTALAVPATIGFFGDPTRETILAAGLLALLWMPTIPLPRRLVPTASSLAGASLYIYLVHWQVIPYLDHHSPFLATIAALAAGVVIWRAVGAIQRWHPRRQVVPAAFAGRGNRAKAET